MAHSEDRVPTLEYILDLLHELEDDYQRKDDVRMLERIRQHREGTWRVPIPERLKEVTGVDGIEYRDPTIADELITIPTMFTRDRPSLTITPARETPETQAQTTKLETFTMAALFDDIGRRSPGPSTYERMTDAVFEGGAWVRLILNKDRWRKRYSIRRRQYENPSDYSDAVEDYKREGGVPIEWQLIDAMNIYPRFAGTELCEVIEVQKRSISQVCQQFGISYSDGQWMPDSEDSVYRSYSTTDTHATPTTCEFLQHWTDTHATYIVREGRGKDGLIVRQWEHKYRLGRPPYYCAYGWTKNYEHGRLVTWSASEPKRAPVEYVSTLRSMFIHLGIRDAIPPITREIPESATPIRGEDGQPPGPTLYELGMETIGLPGERRRVVEFPLTSDKLLMAIDAAQRDIERLSPARVAGNLGDLGGAGFALASVYEKDQLRYIAFENSIKQVLTEVTRDLWKLLASLKEDVHVFRVDARKGGWITCTPADFKRPCRPEWRLNVDSTSSEIVKERYLASRVQNGSLHTDGMIERLGDNPDIVHRGRAVDRIRANQAYLAAEEAAVFAYWGQGDWELLQAQAMRMADISSQQQGTAQGLQGGAGMTEMADPAALAMSPAGSGAAPGTEMQMGGMPGGMPTGMPQGPTVPTAAATAGLRSLG